MRKRVLKLSSGRPRETAQWLKVGAASGEALRSVTASSNSSSGEPDHLFGALQAPLLILRTQTRTQTRSIVV